MIPKRSGKRIFGAQLTVAEKKAMEAEIQRQLAEYNSKNAMEIDAVILWLLHEEFGFGPVRLRRFYDGFIKGITELRSRYELNDSEQIWLCTQRLKEYGIDLEQWHKEGDDHNGVL